MGREVFHLLIYSPCGHHGQNQAVLKPGASYGSYEVQSRKDLDHPPHHIQGIGSKWSTQDTN